MSITVRISIKRGEQILGRTLKESIKEGEKDYFYSSLRMNLISVYWLEEWCSSLTLPTRALSFSCQLMNIINKLKAGQKLLQCTALYPLWYVDFEVLKNPGNPNFRMNTGHFFSDGCFWPKRPNRKLNFY